MKMSEYRKDLNDNMYALRSFVEAHACRSSLGDFRLEFLQTHAFMFIFNF